MADRRHQPADLLDQFSEALQTSRQTSSPESLDTGIANIARAIQQATREANPDSGAMARVWQTLDAANVQPALRPDWASPPKNTSPNGHLRRVDEREGATPILTARPHAAAPPLLRPRRRTREVFQLVAEVVLLVAGAGLLVLLFRGSGDEPRHAGDVPATIAAEARLNLQIIPDWKVSGATLDGSVLGGIGFAPDGTMYVADLANSRILHLRADGSLIAPFGTPGSGVGALMLSPALGIPALGVDSAGNLYVPDYGNSRIQIFAPDGSHLATWDASGGLLGQPYAVAVDHEDTVIVVDYLANEDLWRVLKFDRDGNHLSTIDRDESGESIFGNLAGIAIDGEGNLYVCDERSNRILKFDGQGRFLLAWGGSGTGPGQFNEPTSVAVDHDGTVYVTDAFNFRVQRFDTDGQYLGEWSDTTGGTDTLDRPFNVAVSNGGAIYVVDAGNALHRYRVVTP